MLPLLSCDKNENMKRVGFCMKLNDGMAEEYKKRHDDIWPELVDLLHAAGISDYTIFHDSISNNLFGTMLVSNPQAVDELPKNPVMKKWWHYMADIMAANADNSPQTVPLVPVFYMA